jgi:hypothetical protein
MGKTITWTVQILNRSMPKSNSLVIGTLQTYGTNLIQVGQMSFELLLTQIHTMTDIIYITMINLHIWTVDQQILAIVLIWEWEKSPN